MCCGVWNVRAGDSTVGLDRSGSVRYSLSLCSMCDERVRCGGDDVGEARRESSTLPAAPPPEEEAAAPLRLPRLRVSKKERRPNDEDDSATGAVFGANDSRPAGCAPDVRDPWDWPPCPSNRSLRLVV